MFAAESRTSRHYIESVAMARLCILLGGHSYVAGSNSLTIADATCYKPGSSGPGRAWTDVGHLEPNSYSGEAIGAGGDWLAVNDSRVTGICGGKLHRKCTGGGNRDF